MYVYDVVRLDVDDRLYAIVAMVDPGSEVGREVYDHVFNQLYTPVEASINTQIHALVRFRNHTS